jgi:hypothetical protein
VHGIFGDAKAKLVGLAIEKPAFTPPPAIHMLYATG